MVNETTQDTLECSRCNLTSTLKDAFQRGRDSSGKPFRLCPICWQKRAADLSAAQFWAFAIVGLAGLLIPTEAFRWSMCGVALTYFAAIVLTLPHELAHAVVGRFAGFRIYKIQLGWYGKRWWRCKFGNITIEFRGHLLGGVTFGATKNPRCLRLRYMSYVAAGPAFHAVMIVALFQLDPNRLASTWLACAFWIVVLANLYLLGISLYPRQYLAMDGPAQSDGLTLYNLLFTSRAEFLQHAMMYFWMETLDRLERRDYRAALEICLEAMQKFPGNPSWEILHGICRLQLDEPSLAKDAFLKVHTSADCTPELKATMLNNIAWTDLELRDAQLLPEAVDYSAQAYQALPWLAEIKGTRGSVLVETGEVDAGIALLRQALEQNEDPSNRAWNAAFISRGLQRQRRSDEADAMWTLAESLAPDCRHLTNWRLIDDESGSQPQCDS